MKQQHWSSQYQEIAERTDLLCELLTEAGVALRRLGRQEGTRPKIEEKKYEQEDLRMPDKVFVCEESGDECEMDYTVGVGMVRQNEVTKRLWQRSARMCCYLSYSNDLCWTNQDFWATFIRVSTHGSAVREIWVSKHGTGAQNTSESFRSVTR